MFLNKSLPFPPYSVLSFVDCLKTQDEQTIGQWSLLLGCSNDQRDKILKAKGHRPATSLAIRVDGQH
jgi:hypothetical protein